MEEERLQLSLSRENILKFLLVIVSFAALFTLILVIKSIVDFSHTGPDVQNEVMARFKIYGIYALGRLGFWAFILSAFMSLIGVVIYYCIAVLFNLRLRWYWAVVACGASFAIITFLQFCRHLLYIPGSIVASSLYRNSRFYPLWEQLSPERLLIFQLVLLIIALVFLMLCSLKLIKNRDWTSLIRISGVIIGITAVIVWVFWTPESVPRRQIIGKNQKLPNIIMIGSDSLRADRLGMAGYKRNLTPFIDSIAQSGTVFANTYVPIARTAPSITTFLTGTWPHTHGIRHNYMKDNQVKLSVTTLPEILSKAGYRTGVVTDWAGSDLGKIQFGFDYVDAPDDQWNLKYLIRQGPKDIRLFLSLFSHNRFGKTFLPEIYYLAGTPLNRDLGRNARQKIGEWADSGEPFFLLVFTSCTHGPFGSEYPYYTLYANPEYRGESKFSMAGLTTPSEVVKRQGQGKKSFDVQQINDLYDGAVRSFDDEVARLVKYLQASGLSKNTILFIFSDHGVELFERYTWGQGNDVLGNDYSARVPLIVLDPRIKSAGVVSNTVRSVDFLPTLLDMVGLPIPHTVDGVSLLPYLRTPEIDLKLTAFYETGIWLKPVAGMKEDHLKYSTIVEMLEVLDKDTGTLSIRPEFEDIIVEAKDRMIRNDRWKLVYLPLKSGATYMLFDMFNDPETRMDVSSQYPEIFSRFKSELIFFMTQDKNR